MSTLLIEKNILIQLANSDTKEFFFRWQLVHDDANRKLQSLDNAINDVQNWERRLLELQDWIIYMDKYLSTRIDQDIFVLKMAWKNIECKVNLTLQHDSTNS